MKKALKPIIIISVAVLIILLSKLPKHDKEEIQLFENHRAEFELVNDYIIENFGNIPEKKEIISIIRQAREITGLYHNGDIRIDKSVRKALNSIKDCFKHDFSHIEITDERISYGGLGYRMYVYSRNAKVPKYYYHEGDGDIAKIVSAIREGK